MAQRIADQFSPLNRSCAARPGLPFFGAGTEAMGREDDQMGKLLWGTVLLAVLVAFALGQAVAHGGGVGAKRWLLAAVGAPVMALEPVRDAVQTSPWLPADSVIADLPGAYPVVAATRPVPVWAAVRAVHAEPRGAQGEAP